MANIKSVKVETEVLGANQHIVYIEVTSEGAFQRRQVFHSYNKPVAATTLFVEAGKAPRIIAVRSAEFDSVTTSKHVNKWLAVAGLYADYTIRVAPDEIEALLRVEGDATVQFTPRG